MQDEAASTPMPLYLCHKEVWALKIKSVQHCGPGGEVNPEDGTSVIMHFEDDHFSPRQESTVNRPKPDAGWYFVIYEDGYHSFSPGKKFEEGYTRKQ